MATIAIEPQWFDNLTRYLEGLQATTLKAASESISYLHEAVVNRARADLDWSDLADNIEVWAQDGMLVIGVQDSAFVSQAFALEYGDANRPPNALFRDLSGEVRSAGQRMRQSMNENYGYGTFV